MAKLHSISPPKHARADGQLKVFLAGLPATGSRAVSQALKRIGYVTTSPAAHARITQALGAQLSEDNQVDSDKHSGFGYGGVLDGVEVTGGGVASGFFREVLAQNPDCKFVVTVRDLRAWWHALLNKGLAVHDSHGASHSRHSHSHTHPDRDPAGGGMSNSMKTSWMLGTGSHGIAAEYVAKAHYRQHLMRLVRTIPPERMLILDVHRDTSATLWRDLCMFLHESRCTHKILSSEFPRASRHGEEAWDF
jgi:hypothetical protein